MPEPTQVYTTRIHGLWNTRHEFADEEAVLGSLSVKRDLWGAPESGAWQPEKGEVYLFRRDPGLLRGQFSMWTDTREWLGSSLRWSYMRREFSLHNGGKPFRLLPSPLLGKGWVLYAPKTGESARIEGSLLGRGTRIEVYRRLDFPLLVFAYFLASQSFLEGLWPGPTAEQGLERTGGSSL